VADAAAFSFADVTNPDVVIWDLHESDERDRGAIFAALKARLVEHMLAVPGRAAFIVDEAVTVPEDELGARTLGDLGPPRPPLRPRAARADAAGDGLVRHAHRAHDPERRSFEVVRPSPSAWASG
jgi:hypothetical protein